MSVIIAELSPGDVVQHRGSGNSYVVIRTHGDQVTAVRSVEISNPDEWVLFSKGVVVPAVSDSQ